MSRSYVVDAPAVVVVAVERVLRITGTPSTVSAWARRAAGISLQRAAVLREDAVAAHVLHALRDTMRRKLSTWLDDTGAERMARRARRSWLAEEAVRTALHALRPDSPARALAEQMGGGALMVLCAAYPEAALLLGPEEAGRVRTDPRRMEGLLIAHDDPSGHEDHFSLTSEEWEELAARLGLGSATAHAMAGMLRDCTHADLRSLLAALRLGWTPGQPLPDGLTAAGFELAGMVACAGVEDPEADQWHAAESLAEKLHLHGHGIVERLRQALVQTTQTEETGVLNLQALVDMAAGPLRPALLVAWERGNDDMTAVLRTARLMAETAASNLRHVPDHGAGDGWLIPATFRFETESTMDGWGRRLREVRRRWHLSQGQLAVAAGVSENTVRSWERNRRAPSHEYALRVLRALRARGVPEAELRWLLEGSSSPVVVKEPMQTQAHCRPTASQKAISSMPGKAPLR